MSKARGPYRVDPLGYKKAQKALDKMAENARELGLDYEPAQKPQRWAVFCQGCRKEWSVSYPHPGKDICVDCDDKPAQQEPVAWMTKTGSVWKTKEDETDQPLYTSPPAQRKPLTDEQIEDIWADCPADWDDKINVLTLARAIEAAHGIKENT